MLRNLFNALRNFVVQHIYISCKLGGKLLQEFRRADETHSRRVCTCAIFRCVFIDVVVGRRWSSGARNDTTCATRGRLAFQCGGRIECDRTHAAESRLPPSPANERKTRLRRFRTPSLRTVGTKPQGGPPGTMTEFVPHQDLILDAIDQLRRRKARPDAERIYNCLFRRKGLGSSESRTALDRCVESGVVLRVSYKGNISYRNAAKKYSRQKRRAALAELAGSSVTGGGGGGGGTTTVASARPVVDNKPRRKFTNLLTNTFAELVLQEPDYLDLGIPPTHLIKTILDKDNVRYKKNYLVILLQKEVENGGLVRLDNGNFLVGKPPPNGARKHHHQPAEKDKEQLTRIKREMRNHHVIHRKPFEAAKSAYSSLQDELKLDEDEDADGGGDGSASGSSSVEGERRGRRARTPTPIVDSEESQESRTTAHTDASERSDDVRPAAVVARRTVAAAARPPGVVPPPRGRGRPPLKRGVLVARSRIASKRERLAMDSINSLRVGGRRKKAKKVFDPSESNMPKKRGRPLGSTKSNGYKKLVPSQQDDSRPESRASQTARPEGGVCSVCHIQSKRGPAEKMISCRECSNKAHASCLNGDDMMLKMYPDNTWQCPHCKTCVVCFETSDAGNLVVCSICADAYHNTCHSPKVSDKTKPTTKWLCNNCKMADQLAVDHIQIGYSIESSATNEATNDETPENTIQSPDLSRNSSPHSHLVSAPSSPTLPTLSPQQNHAHNGNGNGHPPSCSESDSKSDIHVLKHEAEEEDEEMDTIDENIDPSIPDASNWSPEEVAHYFAEYFPQEAQVFKEQEIDGHSLLLMRRMDVLKGLHLKLGPALKIYRHVLKLQYRRDDRKLYWV